MARAIIKGMQTVIGGLVITVGLGTLQLVETTAADARDMVAFKNPYVFSAQYDSAKKKIDVRISNHCTSSGVKFVKHDINVTVDENYATIHTTGSFTFKRPVNSPVTADCGGARHLKFTLPNVKPRRYSVVINNKYAGIVDFTTSNKVQKVESNNTGSKRIRIPGINRYSFSYGRYDLKNWHQRDAAVLIDLFRPILKSHPESLEGKPSMDMSIVTHPSDDTLIVRFTNYGYLDDSISGEKFLAEVTEGTKGWHLKSLWRQSLCARGAKAGQWTKSTCP